VPSGAWQPLGSGGATWQGEGRTAEAARAVGGGWGDAWTGGAALQKLGKRPAAAVTRARRGTEEIGGSGKTMEDPVAKSRKARDPTVKHQQLLNECSNGDGPKSKSVQFFKIYNFALRFIHRRGKDLQLL
jgi:hypothetical protein